MSVSSSSITDTVIDMLTLVNNLNLTTTIPTITTGSGGVLTTICSSVGIQEDVNKKEEINIYPNPFNRGFKVSGLKFKVGEKTFIKIYDVMGTLVFQKQLLPDKTQEELSLSFLQQGIYFLTIKTQEGVFTRKIMKM